MPLPNSVLKRVTLAPGEALEYHEGVGWQVIGVDGLAKVGGGLTLHEGAAEVVFTGVEGEIEVTVTGLTGFGGAIAPTITVVDADALATATIGCHVSAMTTGQFSAVVRSPARPSAGSMYLHWKYWS